MKFTRKRLSSSILLLGISLTIILMFGTGAQTQSTVIVRLLDSSSNPLTGGSLRYYDGSWNTADNNGDGTFTVTTYASSVTYEMTYAGAAQTKSNLSLTTNPVDFQTLNVQVQLKNSAGSFIDQGAVQYYAGTWMNFGSTSGGMAVKELLPYNYKFRMTYASASQEKYQNVGNDPVVVFQTVNVAVQLQNSTGSLIDQGAVQYYAGTWLDLGTTSNGQVAKELLPYNYKFRMTYAYASNEKYQDVGTNPTVIFQTRNVTVQLQSSTTALIDTGTVQYYSGAWYSFGSTTGGQVTKELLPYNYKFRMTYAYASNEKYQDVTSNPTVVFQTKNVAVKLQSSTFAALDTGKVMYYAGAWKDFGTTSGGQTNKELLPYNYKFRMTYAYASNEKYQDVTSNPTVVFQTKNVAVKLQSSTSLPLDTGKVMYYAGAWKDFGTTSGGQANRELLPYNYKFRMTYAFTSNEKYQEVGANPTVVFETVLTSVLLKDKNGSLIDRGVVMYYSGLWKPFGSTTGGLVEKQLLPYNYKFRMTFNSKSYEKYQNTGTDPVVIFQMDYVPVPPTLIVNEPADGISTENGTIMVAGSTDNASVTIKVNGIAVPVASDGSFTTTVSLMEGPNTITIIATNSAGTKNTVTRTVTLSAGTLPPDPITVAPPLDETVATTIDASTKFLYTGPNPIQTNVDTTKMNPIRASVVRGKVLMQDGAPLSGVKVKIMNHSEFGQTLTRADGWFDMAVNGGGILTIHYEKSGYLTVQRQVDVPWQDFAVVDSVVMVQADTRVTVIHFSDTIETARGSVMTDDDGTRQATMFFRQGTKAKMILASGDTVSLDSIQVRATEYTVGPNGPAAMPAALPVNVAYTYCVELSTDEAVQAGADEVIFDQPVPFYVENFLGFPTGTIVPVGYYDRKRAEWIAAPNGVVIKIIGIEDGLAMIDVNGDDISEAADSLALFGFDTVERRNLASLYDIGQSLWRAELSHFSPCDLNWGWKFPDSAKDPDLNPPAEENHMIPDEDKKCGSIIGIQNQSLGQKITLTGTGMDLHYQSNRQPGRLPILNIQVSGPSISSDIQRIEAKISVAGREFRYNFQPAPNLSIEFNWDGKDVYGRTIYGQQKAKVTVSHYYWAYGEIAAANAEQSIKQFFWIMDFMNSFGGYVQWNFDVLNLLYKLRATFPKSDIFHTTIGEYIEPLTQFGGWSLNHHHVYNPINKTIYKGDGTHQSASDVGNVITTEYKPDGYETYVKNVISGPDGSIYFIQNQEVYTDTSYELKCFVIRRHPDGTNEIVAGSGPYGYSGDGGLATQAQLNRPLGLALGLDGSLYIADLGNYRIRKVDPSGIITTIAGNGTPGFSGDFGPAIDAQVIGGSNWYGVGDIAVGPDGSLFISDVMNNRVRRVSTDGIITTIAGNGSYGFGGDGETAINAKFRRPGGLSVGPDGSIYIADVYNHRIRRVSPDGIIETVAGNGVIGDEGDGGPATAAHLTNPSKAVMGIDGILYISDYGNNRIRAVVDGNTMMTFAGGWGDGFEWGDNRPATLTYITPNNIAIDPQGNILFVDGWADLIGGGESIRKISRIYPEYSNAEVDIVSDDGSELYSFNNKGKHLRTRDALTGLLLHQFEYDTMGMLTAVLDSDSLRTTIQRDVEGRLVSIVSPFGQSTTFTLDTSQYITSSMNPAGEMEGFSYKSGGLMTRLTDAKGSVYHFTYDTAGRLILETDPAGGFTSLESEQFLNGYEVTVKTAENRTSKYRVERIEYRGLRRIFYNENGDSTVTIINSYTWNGDTTFYPDGTRTIKWSGPDPRFGMQAPLVKSMTVTTPLGLESNIIFDRTITEMSGVTVTGIIDEVTVNGKKTLSIYDGNSKIVSSVSPLGKVSYSYLDDKGRVIQDSIPGVLSTHYTYNDMGFMMQTRQGDRVIHFSYNDKGRLETVTDPLNRATTMEYDSVGRVVHQTLADGRVIDYSYDANGNLTTLTPPGKPAHAFSHTAVNLTRGYYPPLLPDSTGNTNYLYNLDRQIVQALFSDSSSIQVAYDSTGCGCGGVGKPARISYDRGIVQFKYDPAKGNLTQIISPTLDTLKYTYDGSLPKSVTWKGAVNGSVGVSYNNDFQVTSQTVNGGNSVSFGYDNDGLLTSAGSMTISRNVQNGLMTGTALGSATTDYSYTSTGELSEYTAQYGGSDLFRTNYHYDSVGRIDTLWETALGIQKEFVYHYDLVGRLERVERNDTTLSVYHYDANSNRLSHVTQTDSVTGVYDDQDRLLSYGNAMFGYKATGSLRWKTENGDTTWYEYDLMGNLVSVNMPDGTLIQYLIDGQNRRVGKVVNGKVVKRWLYQNQLNIVAELDSLGNVESRFIYGTRGHVPDYMVRDGVTYRFITDHLGSVRFVVDVASGDVVQYISYDEFGNILTDTNPGFQPFGYAGGLYDVHMGLTRFGARDYDSQICRWTNKDPIGFKSCSFNIYCYVFNNPINLVDPSGLDVITGNIDWLCAMYEMWEKAAYGNSKIFRGEEAVWLVQNKETGERTAIQWERGEEASATWNEGYDFLQENYCAAQAHTHPDSHDPRPSTGSERSDQKAASQTGTSIYTVSGEGIYKIDPYGNTSLVEGPGWHEGLDKKCKENKKCKK